MSPHLSVLAEGNIACPRIHDQPWRPADYSRVRADPSIGKRIARVYTAAPIIDPDALPAYRRLREEMKQQFDFLIRSRSRGGLGVDVQKSAADPYPSAADMMVDVRDHAGLRVYATATGGNPHPFFTDDENDMFRAVHDAFGHGVTGGGFDRHGEEAAWLLHSSMLSGPARAAMATETRGQTSARLWAEPGSPSPSDGFPVQKVFIMPAALRDARPRLARPPARSRSDNRSRR